mmetsp:Transcript_26194/g.83726  ORF Transcript_26194/g.83726 Transcript_26194/m.83726 type:complete len:371 (+) Transcript_26194:1511-2623(+)
MSIRSLNERSHAGIVPGGKALAPSFFCSSTLSVSTKRLIAMSACMRAVPSMRSTGACRSLARSSRMMAWASLVSSSSSSMSSDTRIPSPFRNFFCWSRNWSVRNSIPSSVTSPNFFIPSSVVSNSSPSPEGAAEIAPTKPEGAAEIAPTKDLALLAKNEVSLAWPRCDLTRAIGDLGDPGGGVASGVTTAGCTLAPPMGWRRPPTSSSPFFSFLFFSLFSSLFFSLSFDFFLSFFFLKNFWSFLVNFFTCFARTFPKILLNFASVTGPPPSPSLSLSSSSPEDAAPSGALALPASAPHAVGGASHAPIPAAWGRRGAAPASFSKMSPWLTVSTSSAATCTAAAAAVGAWVCHSPRAWAGAGPGPPRGDGP